MKRKAIYAVILSLAAATIIYVGGCGGGKGLSGVLAPTGGGALITAFVNESPDKLTAFSDEYIGTADAAAATVFGNGTTVIATSGATYLDMASCGAAGCHPDNYEKFVATPHGQAWTKKISSFNASAATGTKYCVQCHTVNAPFIDTNGNHKFEPSLGETGSFGLSPSTTAGTWGGMLGSATFTQASEVPAEFQGIQCENCHGPASLHNGNPNFIVKGSQALGAKTCDPCHQQNEEWVKSTHANSNFNESATEANSTTCAACHSAEGFIAYTDYTLTTTSADIVKWASTNTLSKSNGTATHNIGCAACHDPHNKTNASQLRLAADALCITCHNGRKRAPGTNEHHNNQGRVLNGQGIVNTDGKMLWSAAKLICNSVEAATTADVTATCGTKPYIYSVATTISPTMGATTCVNCHMYSFTDHAAGIELLGHTFKPRTEACQACHSTMDAASVIGRKQSEYTTKWNALKARLDTATAAAAGFTAAQTTLYNNATWNLNYLDYDGSKGVHNSALTAQAFTWTDQILAQLGY